jgi:phosphoglycerate dehydrogenase-like enzyme
MIGRKVIELLKPFVLDVVVVDPYLRDEDAAKLGVAKVTLEEAFATAYVVSNHLPNIPSTVGLLNGSLFAQMRPNATFVNTARGAQVVEAELIDVLRQRPDLMALLDVTDPEPPPADSPFYRLPNVLLSSHIAGSMNHEVIRMADYMLEEFANWRDGRPLRYEVTPALLPLLA